MEKLQTVFLLTLDVEGAGRYVEGVFSSEEKAEQKLEKIIKHYVCHCEMYSVTRGDALAYLNPGIKECLFDDMSEVE